MILNHRFHLILFLLGFCLSNVNAQQKTPVKKSSVQFRLYRWFDLNYRSNEQPKIKDLYYLNKGKYIPIKTKPAEKSAHYKANLVESTLHLYRKAISDEGEVIYISETSCKIATGAKDLFIYLFNFKKGIKLLPISLNESTFPKNSMFVINMSKKNIYFTLNGKKKPINKESKVNIPYQINKKQRLRIHIVSANDNKKILGVSPSSKANQRVVAVFFPTNKGRQHRLILERGIDNK